MNDKLQTGSENDGGATFDTENQEGDDKENLQPGTVDSGAELAPATDGEQGKTADDGDSQDKANKAINKQHGKYRKEERRADSEKKRADDAESELAALKAEQGDVVIPNLPDRIDFDSDEEFNEKVKVRDTAIALKATQDAQKENVIEQQNANADADAKVENDRIVSLAGEYDKKITALGLDPVEIRTAGDIVLSYGLQQPIIEHIMRQEEGPLIAKYLAANPLELDELRGMSQIDAAMKVNTDIKLAASALKPQASNADDPPEVLSGRGAGEPVDEFIKGATFE